MLHVTRSQMLHVTGSQMLHVTGSQMSFDSIKIRSDNDAALLAIN